MKKIYLIALATAVSTVSFAQWNVSANPARRNFTKNEISPMVVKHQEMLPAVPGMRVELLNENFEGVMGTLPGNLPSNWSTNQITDSGSNLVNAFRVHNSTTANNGGYWPVPITTVGNKFAGTNDDGSPCDCDNIDAYLQTPEMDFSVATNVAITFDIFHDRGFGGGDATLQVSTDGGTNFNIITIGVDSQGNNVDVLPVDVDYWQTIIIPVYDLAGQASVIFRFQWTDAGSWASGFAVDNVIVGELPNFDLKADKIKTGDWNQTNFGPGVWDYSQVPLTQVSPILSTVVVSNNGFNDQENVSAVFDVQFNGTSIAGSPFTSGQTSATLLSLDKDTLSVITNYTPSALGTVSVDATILSTTGDDVPGNNSASVDLEITQFIYARDANGAQAFVNPGTDYEYGNLFDIYADDDFGGILFAVGAGSTEGALVIGRVYEWTGLDDQGLPVLSADPVAETIEYTVLASDLNGVGENNFTFLPFYDGAQNGSVTLEANKTYLVTVASAGDVRVPVSGSNEWVSSWLFNGTWGATLSIPMVRLTSDQSASVTPASVDPVSVAQSMPNPASDYTVINYSLQNNESVSLTMRDISGRIVAVQNEGNKTAGKQSLRLDVQTLSAGIYTYTLTAGSFNVTRRLVVR